MDAISVQDVVDVAPELVAFAQQEDGAAFILKMIGFASDIVSEQVWGNSYPYALALMAAHLVLSTRPSLGGLVAGGGVVQSVTVGSISKSYASSSSVKASGMHGSTRPGALYDSLLETRGAGFVYVGAGCAPGPGWPVR